MKGIYSVYLNIIWEKGRKKREGHSYSFSSVDMLLYVLGMELPLKLLLSA